MRKIANVALWAAIACGPVFAQQANPMHFHNLYGEFAPPAAKTSGQLAFKWTPPAPAAAPAPVAVPSRCAVPLLQAPVNLKPEPMVALPVPSSAAADKIATAPLVPACPTQSF
jgi:hypothetical protein